MIAAQSVQFGLELVALVEQACHGHVFGEGFELETLVSQRVWILFLFASCRVEQFR